MEADKLIGFYKLANSPVPDFNQCVEFAIANPSILSEGSPWPGGVLEILIRARGPVADRLAAIERLIQAGARPEGPERGSSTVSAAVSAGEIEILRYLLPRVNMATILRDPNDNPIVGAIVSNQPAAIQPLLDAGMDPVSLHGKQTMIEVALQWGRTEIAEILAKAAGRTLDAGEVGNAMTAQPRSATNVLMGMTVSVDKNRVSTRGFGGETPQGEQVELMMEVEPIAASDAWPIHLLLSGANSLRGERGIALDIGELVPLAPGNGLPYSHMLFLRDAKAGGTQWFRGFPLLPSEADFAQKNGGRALLVEFQAKQLALAAPKVRKAVV